MGISHKILLKIEKKKKRRIFLVTCQTRDKYAQFDLNFQIPSRLVINLFLSYDLTNCTFFI